MSFVLPSSLFLPPECARQTKLASNRNPPASASRVLGLKVCAAISALCLSKGCIWCHAMSRPDFTSSFPMGRHLTPRVVLCYSIKIHWTLLSFPKSTRICLRVFMPQHVREVRVPTAAFSPSTIWVWGLSCLFHQHNTFLGPGFLMVQGKLTGKGKSLFSWSFIVKKVTQFEMGTDGQSVGDKEEGFLPWDLCEQGSWRKEGLK